MKISSRIHGIIDYAVVFFLLMAPKLFGLPNITAKFTYVLAGIHLALTACTDFEYGMFRKIPFKVHGIIELIVSIALAGAAFYFQGIEGELARNFYLAFATAVFLTWCFTDYSRTEI